MGVEKLIFKYLQGKLSREEQKELDEWLKDEKNKKTFSRLVDKHRIMMKMIGRKVGNKSNINCMGREKYIGDIGWLQLLYWGL